MVPTKTSIKLRREYSWPSQVVAVHTVGRFPDARERETESNRLNGLPSRRPLGERHPEGTLYKAEHTTGIFCLRTLSLFAPIRSCRLYTLAGSISYFINYTQRRLLRSYCPITYLHSISIYQQLSRFGSQYTH